MVLVLYDGHGSELPPVAPGGRSSTGAQVERAVLAVVAVVGCRAVLAHAEGAAKAQACSLELLPAGQVTCRRCRCCQEGAHARVVSEMIWNPPSQVMMMVVVVVVMAMMRPQCCPTYVELTVIKWCNGC